MYFDLSDGLAIAVAIPDISVAFKLRVVAKGNQVFHIIEQ